jgi:hypothetical protein
VAPHHQFYCNLRFRGNANPVREINGRHLVTRRFRATPSSNAAALIRSTKLASDRATSTRILRIHPQVRRPTTHSKIFALRMSSNNEVERRGVAPTSNETDLSRSSTISLARRRCSPRSLEPIVRTMCSTKFSRPEQYDLPSLKAKATTQHARGHLAELHQDG